MGKRTEDLIQREAFRTLATHGYIMYTGRDHYSGVNRDNLETESPGRSDMMFVKKVAAAIEIKAFGDNFKFDELRNNQIEWALQYWQSKNHANALYWIWVGAGTGRPNSKGFNRRYAWLIPLDDFLYYKNYVEQVANLSTIPLYPGQQKVERIAVRERKLYATRLFIFHELRWVGNSKWEIPEDHAFRKTYQLI